jgi:pilus assembly protein Flp/PilA
MRSPIMILRALSSDVRGATAVEYALILAMVVLALIAGVSSLGQGTQGMWGDMSNKVKANTPS